MVVGEDEGLGYVTDITKNMKVLEISMDTDDECISLSKGGGNVKAQSSRRNFHRGHGLWFEA